jgi:hypothetical protein
MGKPNVKKAKIHLTKLRQLASKKKTQLSEMTEEEVINTMHKTREEIWDKKLKEQSKCLWS